MKITLNRRAAMGDVIFVEPIARALSDAGHDVYVQTEQPEVFQNHPTVSIGYPEDSILIDLDRSYEKYDRYGSKLAQLHYLDEVCKLVSLEVKDLVPKLYLSKEEKDYARLFLPTQWRFACIDSGYGMRSQIWTPEEWLPVLRGLKDQGYRLVFVGNKSQNLDPLDDKDLDLRGKTSKRQVMAVIGASDFFIGPDSGLLHVANALGVPGVGIFGVVRPEWRLPKESTIQAVSFHKFDAKPIIRVIESIQKPNLYNVHRRDQTNLGDMMSTPTNYFKFRNCGVYQLNIYNKSFYYDGNGFVVVGGGGLGCFPEPMKALLTHYSGKLIGWGLGDNQPISEVKYPKFYDRFDLLGVRDFLPGYEWVPCASCMHHLFDVDYKTENEIVVYEHLRHPIDLVDAPKMNNSEKMENVIPFLGSGDIVLTSSYHGMYWATLLNKRVMVVPTKQSNTFIRAKHPAVISFDPKKIKATKRYPEALAESRLANERFYERVLNFIDQPLEIKPKPVFL